MHPHSLDIFIYNIGQYKGNVLCVQLQNAKIRAPKQVGKNPPCSSMNLRAFSKKDGVPSTSSRASKIGRPMTVDLTGSASFTIQEQKILKESKKIIRLLQHQTETSLQKISQLRYKAIIINVNQAKKKKQMKIKIKNKTNQHKHKHKHAKQKSN